ncbi:hypothetical protein BGY98DRAFT_517340 [Russula aff. rugulosa BPL654]|nr:hypothetical protein BGY98DRAFT_517340 [Russula aff. rugulosa BPL654]
MTRTRTYYCERGAADRYEHTATESYSAIWVRALICQVTPTTLLSTSARPNRPQTPRVSRLVSLPLLCQRRILPLALHTRTSSNRTMATLLTSYSLPTLRRRTNLTRIKISQKAGKETCGRGPHLYWSLPCYVAALFVESYKWLPPSSSDIAILLTTTRRPLQWLFHHPPIPPARPRFSTINLAHPREQFMVHHPRAIVRPVQAYSDTSLSRGRYREILSSSCCRSPQAR